MDAVRRQSETEIAGHRPVPERTRCSPPRSPVSARGNIRPNRALTHRALPLTPSSPVGRPPNAPQFLSDRLEQRDRPLRAQDRPQRSRYYVRIPEGHRRRATVRNRRGSRNRSVCVHISPSFWTTCSEFKVARDRYVDEASRRRPLAARAAPKVPRRVPPRRYGAQSGTTALCLGPSAVPLACAPRFAGRKSESRRDGKRTTEHAKPVSPARQTEITSNGLEARAVQASNPRTYSRESRRRTGVHARSGSRERHPTQHRPRVAVPFQGMDRWPRDGEVTTDASG